ncbi:MAG TPA: hypothetical protein VHK91_18340 [Flavisolibacter sp.]|jgi:hypothetical protein|nr:hypothetical protein [Flavisolibacter sp.]
MFRFITISIYVICSLALVVSVTGCSRSRLPDIQNPNSALIIGSRWKVERYELNGVADSLPVLQQAVFDFRENGQLIYTHESPAYKDLFNYSFLNDSLLRFRKDAPVSLVDYFIEVIRVTDTDFEFRVTDSYSSEKEHYSTRRL